MLKGDPQTVIVQINTALLTPNRAEWRKFPVAIGSSAAARMVGLHPLPPRIFAKEPMSPHYRVGARDCPPYLARQTHYCNSDSGEGCVILVGAAAFGLAGLILDFSHFTFFSLAICIVIYITDADDAQSPGCARSSGRLPALARKLRQLHAEQPMSKAPSIACADNEANH